MKTAYITTIIILLINITSYATQISGDIYGTLSAEDSPYEVVGNLRVPQCSTLVIEPGCYLDFQQYYAFVVDTSATLKAMGESQDSIIFTATDFYPGWGSIRFLDNCDSCELNYCIIEKSYAGRVQQGDYRLGGGIYAYNTDLIIRHCAIQDNEAYEGYGGGLYLESSFITIIESDIIRNNSSFNGAGIYCGSTDLTLSYCNVSENISWYVLGSGWGGGLSINHSTISIDNTDILNNWSGQYGGGIYITSSYAEIINNRVMYNGVLEGAGGLSIGSCSLVVMTNNVVAYNEADLNTGGILCGGTDIILDNNIIYGNSAPYICGGLLISESSIDTVSNNIIWRNEIDGDTLNPYSQIRNNDSSLVFVYSCIQGGWDGEGNIDTDPMFVDPDNGDFNLSWENYPIEDETKSPCIDTGAPWFPLDPDSTRADMGALFFDQWISPIDDPEFSPVAFSLSPNYPNPFNARTVISYSLPQQSDVTIDIYDILGRQVKTLIDGSQTAGIHQVIWNAADVSSGVYFYKLTAGDYNKSKKMMLVK